MRFVFENDKHETQRRIEDNEYQNQTKQPNEIPHQRIPSSRKQQQTENPHKQNQYRPSDRQDEDEQEEKEQYVVCYNEKQDDMKTLFTNEQCDKSEQKIVSSETNINRVATN